MSYNELKKIEAARFNTTVEALEESGFVFLSDALGGCHWFALFHGTLMSLSWFREQRDQFRAQLKSIK